MRWRIPVGSPVARRWLAAVLVVGGGVLLTAVAFTTRRRMESQHIEADFRRRSSVLASGFQRLLEGRLDALRSLTSFDAASTYVRRVEFQTFAASIRAGLPSIQALEWAPRVTDEDRPEHERSARIEGHPLFQFTERDPQRELVRASRRPEYFPVYFLEPTDGNEAALGFDLASDAARKAAMEKARDTGRMIATERIGLIQDPGRRRGFLVLVPVYRRELPHQTVAQRRVGLKGFYVGVFRTDEIVNQWRSTMPSDGIAFVLKARGEGGDDTILHAREESSPARRPWPIDEKTFELAGSTWTLQFQPAAGYLARQKQGGGWGTLTAGLAFVALLGALLAGSAIHTEKIERAGRELEEALAQMRLSRTEADLLDGVMQKINVGVGLDQILDYVFDSFDAIIPYDRIGWAAIERDGHVASRWSRSKCGSPSDTPDQGVRLAGSSLGLVAASGTPRVIDDLDSYVHEYPDSVSTPLVVAHGMRSNLACPLLVSGKAVGFLFFSSTRSHAYQPEHVQTYMRIANKLALTVHKGRLYDEVGDELHDSEKRFELAVRGTDAGVWDWDLLAGRVYFSPRWKSMLGYAAGEIGDRFEEWERLVHREDRDRALATLRDYLEGRSSVYELEHRLRHKDGTYRWIVARGALVNDGFGRPNRMVGWHIDVTGRKLAEESLRETRSQLLAAQRIQEQLLPKAPPDVPGFDIAGACYPASFTAGDYFDYLRMGDGSVVLVVADVMGHGFGPALLAASVQAYLRSVEGTTVGIAHMAASLNRLLLRATEDGRFVTLILARLDPEAMTVHYVNAGHPSGYVIDDSGAVKAVLDSSTFPLGLDSETPFVAQGPVPLARGDLLLLMTDGIAETRSPQEEQFGTRRVLDLVGANRARSAHDLIVVLREAATGHSKRIELLDDLTAVVVKFQKSPCAAGGPGVGAGAGGPLRDLAGVDLRREGEVFDAR
jgi:PAS domain S-box-containing protein